MESCQNSTTSRNNSTFVSRSARSRPKSRNKQIPPQKPQITFKERARSASEFSRRSPSSTGYSPAGEGLHTSPACQSPSGQVPHSTSKTIPQSSGIWYNQTKHEVCSRLTQTHPLSGKQGSIRSESQTRHQPRSPTMGRRSPLQYATQKPRPKSAEILDRKYSSKSEVPQHKVRSLRSFSANVTNRKKIKTLNKWYNKDHQLKKLREGEVFSPILWRKFHIDEHLFDIPTENELSNQEMNDNFKKMKMKYPHLTKQHGLYGTSAHREKVLSEGYHPTSRFDASEDNNKQKHLWQRHVDMLKVSKSTSYFNFLSHFDRQSCRACSHSKTCSSKHCPSCDCGTKCEKHSVNIDFLRYIPNKPQETPQAKETPDKHLKTAHTPKKTMVKKYSEQSLNMISMSSQGYTMKGFTIMRKTPDMERKTLLSQHIEGKPGGAGDSGKSSNKKCLACAFAKENVLMQNIKPPGPHNALNKKTGRLSKNYAVNTVLYY